MILNLKILFSGISWTTFLSPAMLIYQSIILFATIQFCLMHSYDRKMKRQIKETGIGRILIAHKLDSFLMLSIVIKTWPEWFSRYTNVIGEPEYSDQFRYLFIWYARAIPMVIALIALVVFYLGRRYSNINNIK